MNWQCTEGLLDKRLRHQPEPETGAIQGTEEYGARTI